MNPWLVAGALGLGALLLRRRASASIVPSAGLWEVWTLDSRTGFRCGVPLCPSVTGGYGEVVHELDLPAGARGWGWTPPGDLRAAGRYGQQLVADVESRGTTTAKPSAGWTGEELEDAGRLADLAGAVTSHGYVFKSLRGVLGAFAARDRVAYPQVYDSDRSTDPKKFLRQCVDMYRDAGFRHVVPLLGVSAGADWVQAWIDECDALGVAYAFWSLERMNQIGLGCGE